LDNAILNIHQTSTLIYNNSRQSAAPDATYLDNRTHVIFVLHTAHGVTLRHAVEHNLPPLHQSDF